METTQAALAALSISEGVETDDEFDLDIRLITLEHIPSGGEESKKCDSDQCTSTCNDYCTSTCSYDSVACG